MRPIPEKIQRGFFDPIVLAALAAGLALSVAGLLRNQPVGDQVMLLVRGWKLAAEGVWFPLGLPTSGGGYMPGGLTALLVGLPLAAWPDPRAPVAILVILHLIGYLLLDRLVLETLGTATRRVFALLYWLNPWRVFYSAFLWTPNYMFFFAAVHLWTLYRQRREPRFASSFTLVLVLGAAAQIHLSASLLIAATAVLWWRRYFRLHLLAAATAAAVVALSLVPWVALAIEEPAVLPLASESQDEGGFNPGFGLFRGWLYWLRFPTPGVSRVMVCFDLGWLLGPQRAAAVAGPILWSLVVIASIALLVSLVVHLRLWRRAWRRWLGLARPPATGRAWLRGVIGWTLVSSASVFALSPTTLMNWQILPLFHLSVVFFSTAVVVGSRSRIWPRLKPWAVAWGALLVILSIAVIAASPPYRLGEERCGARHFTAPPADHPDLGDAARE